MTSLPFAKCERIPCRLGVWEPTCERNSSCNCQTLHIMERRENLEKNEKDLETSGYKRLGIPLGKIQVISRMQKFSQIRFWKTGYEKGKHLWARCTGTVIFFEDLWQLTNMWKCSYFFYVVHRLIEGFGNQHVATNAVSAAQNCKVILAEFTQTETFVQHTHFSYSCFYGRLMWQDPIGCFPTMITTIWTVQIISPDLLYQFLSHEFLAE